MVAIPRKIFVMIDRHSSVEVISVWICVVHAWEIAEKSSGTAYKKPGCEGVVEPPILPNLADRAKNSMNVFAP